MKICSKCKELKSFLEFSALRRSRDGFSYSCKACKKKLYYRNHELNLLKRKEYRKKNQDKIKLYRIQNKEKNSLKQKEYRTKNKEKLKLAYQQWLRDNKEHRTQYQKLYLKKYYKKIKINSSYIIKNRLRARLLSSLKAYGNGKTMRANKYGIDYSAIINHLGPCPGKREDYHIDHIIPLSLFDHTNPEQIKIAWAPENHQWLEKKENLKKHNHGPDFLMEEIFILKKQQQEVDALTARIASLEAQITVLQNTIE